MVIIAAVGVIINQLATFDQPSSLTLRERLTDTVTAQASKANNLCMLAVQNAINDNNLWVTRLFYGLPDSSPW